MLSRMSSFRTASPKELPHGAPRNHASFNFRVQDSSLEANMGNLVLWRFNIFDEIQPVTTPIYDLDRR